MGSKPPSVAVVGFGRCGSTMMMQMLAAGGWLPHGQVFLNSMEPVGNWEVYLSNAARKPPPGRSVKFLDYPIRANVPRRRKAPWKVVLLERIDTRAQAESAVRLVDIYRYGRTIDDTMIDKLAESFETDWPKLAAAAEAMGDTIHFRYEQILADPQRAAQKLDKFLPGEFNGAMAASVVRRPVDSMKDD